MPSPSKRDRPSPDQLDPDSAATTPSAAPQPPPGEPPGLSLPASRGATYVGEPPPRDRNSLLQEHPSVAEGESFGEDEKALNLFLKLHPMLSLVGTSQKVMDQLGELLPREAVRDRPIELCTKDHDDLFLRCAPARRFPGAARLLKPRAS